MSGTAFAAANAVASLSGGLSHLVETAAETIDRCASADELCAFVGDLFRRIGFDYFSYFVSDPLLFGNRPALDPMGATSYPKAWRSRYASLGYQEDDPVLQAAGSMRRPFLWSDQRYVDQLSDRARVIFEDARAFGICGGMTVPVYGPSGDSGLMSVSSRESGAAFRSLVRESAPALHVIAHHMHAAMMERLMPCRADGQPKLSDQERVCLLWTLRGKTAWEIAAIIGRSRATVNFHLQKALRKLGTSNKSHAAIKALRAGLI